MTKAASVHRHRIRSSLGLKAVRQDHALRIPGNLIPAKGILPGRAIWLMTTDSKKATDFSAADSAVGYLYQVRLALLSALQRMAEDHTFAVYIETLDDVVFDTSGSAQDLLQLKHHCSRSASLTDASPDLWKSLRIWIEGRSKRTIPADSRLYLVTTSNVGVGSAARGCP